MGGHIRFRLTVLILNLSSTGVSRRDRHTQMRSMGGEQGILNYVIENCANQKKLTLARIDLMLWLAEDLAKVDLDSIVNKQGYKKILHWAGFKYGEANFARRRYPCLF